jgi:hypothetical protein
MFFEFIYILTLITITHNFSTTIGTSAYVRTLHAIKIFERCRKILFDRHLTEKINFHIRWNKIAC